jgi:hypothetical protein
MKKIGDGFKFIAYVQHGKNRSSQFVGEFKPTVGG